MKLLRIATISLACAGATMVHAGGLDDPIVEPEIIDTATVASGHDVLVPIMALVLFGAALASN